MKKIIPLVVLCLSACTPDPHLPKAHGLTYLQQQPLRLNVAHVEVLKEYVPPKKYPNIDHMLPFTPSAMVQQWVQDRLLPVGEGVHALVTIEDASLIEEPLPSTRGIAGIFTVDQSERYSATLSVRIELMRDGQKVGFARATARGNRTVTENLTLTERRQVWQHLMENVLSNLDAELERNVRGYLGEYVL